MFRLQRILPAILIAAMTVGPVSAATAIPANQLIAQANAPSATTAAVNGTINDGTGGPISGASLVMVGPASYTATTDAFGKFAIANVTPGIYTVAVSKPGFNSTSQDNVALVAGQTQQLAIVLQSATLTTLREIGSVRAVGRGTFNTTPASVANVAAQVFADQAQPQVMKILNQTPGIVASYPQTSSNGAVPGAITFPNIRGALAFESLSLLDGHPLSNGTFGDYVSTFINSYMLGNIEVVKGPGAIVPVTNFAIGGAVNYSTKNPTFLPRANVQYAVDNFGGNILQGDYTGSSTNGRFQWALAYSHNHLIGAVNNYPATFDASLNGATIGGSTLGVTTSGLTVPGTSSTIFNAKSSMVACCLPFSGTYNNNSELVKFRYKFSPVTAVTASYLGSQTTADQLGNTSSQINGIFAPGASYGGPTYAGPILLNATFPGTGETEVNNEPIFQLEMTSAIKQDNVIARAYWATIDRLLYEGNANPLAPQTLNLNLYGTGTLKTGAGPAVPVTYNGQMVPVSFLNFFNQTEEDQLHGYSFQYDHHFGGSSVLTAAYDSSHTSTVSFSASPGTPAAPYSYSVTIPQGSSQTFGTLMLRYAFNMGAHWNATLSDYINTYSSTVAVAGPASGPSLPSGVGDTFKTFTSSHNDQRVAVEYRPTSALALRASAGTAIAPPYLFLLSNLPFPPSYNTGTSTYIQTVKLGNILPETAFGWDFGGDWRLNDGVTVISGDYYSTNLYNQFANALVNTGTTFNDGNPAHGTAPLFIKSPINLNQTRYQGIELAVKHNPVVGFGWTAQGALQRGYLVSVGPCFYSATPPNQKPPFQSNCGLFDQNQAIIPGSNFTGGGIGFGGVSNQNVPYAQGYGEVRYAFPNKGLALLGMTYLGNNNSFNVRPFFMMNASLRQPVGHDAYFELSGDNLTNQRPGLFPIQGTGVPIPLAGLNAPGPRFAATTANVLGPPTIRLTFSKNFDFGKPNP